MVKKILILVVVLVFLAGGGFFYWWQGHADERALNKTLPEGVRVDKCLISGEWRVINKIDGYEFKIPEEWQGINEIEYIPEREAEGYVGTSLTIEGNEGMGAVVGLDRYTSGGNMESDLKSWAKSNFDIFGLVGAFTEDKIGEFNVVKTQEEVHLWSEYIYFFKKASAIYAMTCGSEEFIREIILNGKW